MLKSIALRDFRCIERIDNLELGPLNVFFGPNGTGKTSIMDALWVLHCCVVDGPKKALKDTISDRISDYGLVRKGSPLRELSIQIATNILVGTTTHFRKYTINFEENMAGLIPYPGEELSSWSDSDQEIKTSRRKTGSVLFTPVEVDDNGRPMNPFEEPDEIDELYLTRFNSVKEISSVESFSKHVVNRELISVLRNISYHSSRFFRLYDIKQRPSKQVEISTPLSSIGENAWAVLSNLNGQRDTDPQASRYETILKWIRRAFPFFHSLKFQTVGNNIFCEAKLNELEQLVPMNQLADGVIQFALLMAALFGEPAGPQIIMLDEPDLSLHPWALFVLAEAIQEATTKWNRQVLLATHSPVLLSQFPEESLFVMMPKDGATTVTRLTDMAEVKDLIDQYAAGSLYMMQLVGEQSTEPMVRIVDDKP